MKVRSKLTPNLRDIYVKGYGELYEYINNKLKKHAITRNKHSFNRLLKSKLSLAHSIIEDELGKIAYALSLISSSDFYKELYRAYTREEPSLLDKKVRVALRVARRIYKSVINKMDSFNQSRSNEALMVFREGIGRLLSIYKRLSKRISVLKEFLKEVSKMPDISGEYVVVIAGMPQVGKSTLLSKLTNARPIIGTYPFTTKTLIAGHMDVDPCGKIVIVDSPGLLDSPIEEKNIIEYKAVLAVRYLADHLLYLLEPTPFFYYSINEQLDVYMALRDIIGDKPVTLVVNKIDLIDSATLKRLVDDVKHKTGVEPIPISAMTGYNLDLLKENIVTAFKRKTQCP